MTDVESGQSRTQQTVRPGSILRAMQSRAGESPRANLPSLDEPVAATPRAATTPHADPTIEVVRADGRVQKIVAVCGCGERIVIHCDYEPKLDEQTPGKAP